MLLAAAIVSALFAVQPAVAPAQPTATITVYAAGDTVAAELTVPVAGKAEYTAEMIESRPGGEVRLKGNVHITLPTGSPNPLKLKAERVLIQFTPAPTKAPRPN